MKNAVYESRDFSREGIARNETLFTVANGNLGLRGDFEERPGTLHKGTYINGFFDTEPICYGESAYGFAENHETILNLPDPKLIEFTVNGQPFSLETGKVSNFLMRLDFRTGVMSRSLDWTSPAGVTVSILAERLVPMERSHAAAIRYTVRSAGGVSASSVRVALRSGIDTTVRNVGAEEDPRVGSKFSSNPLIITALGARDGECSFSGKTRNSGFPIAGWVSHRVRGGGSSLSNSSGVSDGIAWVEYTANLSAGDGITLEKYVYYRHEKPGFDPVELKTLSAEGLRVLAALGFDALLAEQKQYLDRFWKTAAFEIEGDDESALAIHFNLFHLLQSAGKDGKTSIAAKGLTAEGYEGHYFWDTESYVCPAFTYLMPEVAGKLLEYRYSILDAARRRAGVMSLKGALFPWRTIDGEETSAYYPAGTAQYHINADIIFALRKYLTACSGSGAFDPLGGNGFDPSAVYEMAVETARMWASLGAFIESKGGAFCLNEVTGPDEYTACVNNNAYTNLMARENLRFAISVVESARRRKTAGTEKGAPASASALIIREGLEVSDAELELWKRAESRMYVPYEKETGIYPQDDSFMGKAEWDFTNTPREKYPLLLHFHPLVIYRHRVLKQPDLVLAQFLLSGEFTAEEKARNFAFYEPLTTGDSSLSHCIQSIMACEIGDVDKAERYFDKTARMDIADMHGNTRDGIHTAAMAGSWMSTVYGFAGFRDYGGQWRFSPTLPARWKRLAFRLRLGLALLQVNLGDGRAEYSLEEGDSLQLYHRDTAFTLQGGGSKSFPL